MLHKELFDSHYTNAYSLPKAIDQLLAMGPKTVVISSMECETRPGVLVLLAKTKNGNYKRLEFTL